MSDSRVFNRFYEEQEINTMNIIFGKNEGNKWFSRDELSFASSIDLFNNDSIAQAKQDWHNSFID